MRKQLARTLAIATGIMVLVISAAFAMVMNPASDDAPSDAVAAEAAGAATAGAHDAPAAQIARGRAVFEAQDCMRCHSIAGEGSRRSPLDDVADRLDEAEMRDWILGTKAVADDLSPSALRAKQAYQALPAEDIDALVAYLLSL
ncbi:cytochrome c [Luteimonas sp. SJ-92]|uniref:Cytochrome c n=1 Tax=Luteimonas salinisoli TaxID=2752307 RepID=A0A853JHP6_9GAMM|nr:cytochrome c [Luteimonas salinisoli]NZA28274.1 cytochrome c [Luteimonas salinisoli]